MHERRSSRSSGNERFRLAKTPGGVTISRRSAAETRVLPHAPCRCMTQRRRADAEWSRNNCRHVVRAENTVGVLLARLHVRWSQLQSSRLQLMADKQADGPPDIQAALITALSRKPTCSRLGSGAQTTVFHAQIAQNFLRGALPRTPLGLRPRPHLGLSSPSVPTAGRFPWHGRPRLLVIVSVTKSTVTLWFRPPP